MNAPAVAEVLLTSTSEEDRDRLFPLMAEGPAIVCELTGKKPHKSKLFRHARDGVQGVRLRTVCVGRTLMSTRRWLVEHWAAVDEARRAAAEPPAARPKRRRRTRRVGR